jgi:hypothetical protein
MRAPKESASVQETVNRPGKTNITAGHAGGNQKIVRKILNGGHHHTAHQNKTTTKTLTQAQRTTLKENRDDAQQINYHVKHTHTNNWQMLAR